MTEFKKGDRVQVEFEGIVAAEDTRAGMIFIDSPDKTGYWLHPNYITKLTDPLPTKNGAVIRIIEMLEYPRVFELATVGYWFETGNPSQIQGSRVQELANEYGFTVLYAGDDE